MWIKGLQNILTRGICNGRLHVTFPDGQKASYGPGHGPEATLTLADPALPRRIMLNPQLALGEAFMDGTLRFPDDDNLRQFLQIAAESALSGRLPLPMRLAHRLRVKAKATMQWNSLAVAQKRVKHHYDIPDTFYAMFMEAELQYTCAYYRHDAMTLEDAQAAKMAHIAAKLCLRPGLRVLDIGCGWGGFAFYLARQHDVQVTGITLSQVQLAAAERRAADLGLSDRVRFRLQDYRHVPDRFDRVVSVGMMEHVGAPQYRAYFSKIHQILTDDGIGLIHFIGRHTPPRVLSPWFQKYIFPGGYAPALSEVMSSVESSGLVLTDLEVWRGHYARTLRDWQTRFRAHEPQVRAMFDERFVRMWWWYLVASEVSFTHMGMVLFQMQIARHQMAVPRTRDYLYPPIPDATGRVAAGECRFP